MGDTVLLEDRKGIICGLITNKSSRLDPYQSLPEQTKSLRKVILGSSVGHSDIIRIDNMLDVEGVLWTIVDLHLGTKAAQYL